MGLGFDGADRILARQLLAGFFCAALVSILLMYLAFGTLSPIEHGRSDSDGRRDPCGRSGTSNESGGDDDLRQPRPRLLSNC